MKIYFTPREYINNKFNDEALLTDPNERLEVPKHLKAYEEFNVKLH